MLAIVVASLFLNVEAAPPERSKEKDIVFEFKARSNGVSGAEINADISTLGRLVGMNSKTAAALRAERDKAAEKGWLGVAMKLPAHSAKEPQSGRALRAIEVARIMPGSGAESAGLLESDLIIALDGTPIEGTDDKLLLSFRLAISKLRPGAKVKLSVLRGDTLLELEATIKPSPKVRSKLKSEPELPMNFSSKDPSLLEHVLQDEQLTDEFERLLKEFQNETDKVVSPLIFKDGYNPFRLQEVNYIMYHPLELPVVARKITDRLHAAFGNTQQNLEALVHTGMDELDLEHGPARTGTAKPIGSVGNMTDYVERLVHAIQYARAERMAVLSVFTTEEIDFLYATAPQLLVGHWGPGGDEKSEAEKRLDETRLLRLFSLILKLDLSRLVNAAAAVARAIDLETLRSLDRSTGKLTHYPNGWPVREEGNLTVLDSPAGRVLIGSTQDNLYSEDAALILDFGGNDKYFNHAGGSTRQYPFSVVIDLSGDDVYSATEDFSQGAGLIGGGLLIDLKGKDRYLAKSYSQGAGLLGVGILADLEGDDQYTAIAVSQGAAGFGVGLVAEGGGTDSYFGNYFVQGAGYIKGFGGVIEVSGNDKYFAGGLYEDFREPGKAYLSLSQGFGYGMRPWESFVGASGGIGVIAEAEGNDTFVADYFAQGASYWFSLGILDDRKGNDRYVSGRYAQGAGIHMSAGALIDGAGDDNYLADFGVAQGCGHDYGIGFLLDNGGNDRYLAGVVAQGAGNDNGIGILSDNGGNDEYFLKNRGQGYGNFEPTRDVGSFGLLFDFGGTDNYSQGDKNNRISYKTRWGILIDGPSSFSAK